MLAWEIPGQRSLAGYSLWGHKERDMTEWLNTHTLTHIHTHGGEYRYLTLNDETTGESQKFSNLFSSHKKREKKDLTQDPCPLHSHIRKGQNQ